MISTVTRCGTVLIISTITALVFCTCNFYSIFIYTYIPHCFWLWTCHSDSILCCGVFCVLLLLLQLLLLILILIFLLLLINLFVAVVWWYWYFHYFWPVTVIFPFALNFLYILSLSLLINVLSNWRHLLLLVVTIPPYIELLLLLIMRLLFATHVFASTSGFADGVEFLFRLAPSPSVLLSDSSPSNPISG